MRIDQKIPLFVVVCALLAAASVALVANHLATTAIQAKVEDELLALRSSRQASLERYFRFIREDSHLISQSPEVVQALREMSAAFGRFPEANRSAFETNLRAIFTPGNESGDLIAAADLGARYVDYVQVHQQFHDWLSLIRQVKGYYDLFLIDARGDVVYTSVKEPDFATNMFSDQWRNTGLSKAFRQSMRDTSGDGDVFIDFEPYAPSGNNPASFFAHKVHSQGRVIGVFVLQTPIDGINEIFQDTRGMGETGETYIVGPDFLMRTASRFSNIETETGIAAGGILEQKVETPAVRRALGGETGVAQINDYRGVPVMSAFAPFEFEGTTWAILSEIDMAEALAPLNDFREHILFAFLLSCIFIVVISWLVGRGISQPMAQLSEEFRRYARSRVWDGAFLNKRRDEVGDMAREMTDVTDELNSYFNQLTESRAEIAEKSELLQAVLDSLDQGLAAFDADLKLVAWNFRFLEIRGYPIEFGEPGRSFEEFMRFDVARGEFGDGDPEKTFQFMIERARKFERHAFERARPDGRFVEVKGGPMPQGGFVSTYTDVTARKKAEIALTEKEQHLQSALNNMSGGMFMVDADFNIVLSNDKFREYYSLPPDLLTPGQSYQEVLRIRALRGEYGPGDPDALTVDRKNAYLDQPEARIEDVVEDGRVIELYRAPTADGGIVGVANDITIRKKTEEALADQRRVLERISAQLSKYLSPQVYEQILYGNKKVELETERKKLTVFFSDIKNFTATTDDMEPEDLTFILNDYLTEMSAIALEFGATIDKYVGDAILIFFGDPETEGVSKDATKCVHMAVKMQRHMVSLREKWAGMGFERPFHVRIGVNTGYCNVGNFGSDDRMDYTIIGGEVNLAARLEGQCEPDGVLLSNETYLLVRDHFKATPKAPVHVKGIQREITPYQVEGVLSELEEDDRFIREEREGFRLFVDRKYLEKEGRESAAETLDRLARELRDNSNDQADS